jgi:hypothetical protein
MPQQEQLISAAFSDFQGLLDIHLRFIEEIGKCAKNQFSTSSLTIKDDGLSITYLDLNLSASRRTVAIDSQLVANEYAFEGITFNNEKHTLLCLYLTPNGVLYLDSSLTTRLCDYNNQYVVKNILSKIQLSALSSPFFSPRD